jgi:5'-nucleotidase
VGETRSYDYEKIERAVRLILKGARFIATNPDLTGPTELGITPACGALVAPIELATGKNPTSWASPSR